MKLGPQLIRVGLLVPVRDGLVDSVFQGRAIHTPVEEPRLEVQAANQVEVESVDSLGVKAEMQTKWWTDEI